MELLGWALILLPASVGLANFHLPAAVVSGALSAFALLVGLFVPIIGLLLWLFAFYVGFSAVNKRRRERIESRRHRELLEQVAKAAR